MYSQGSRLIHGYNWPGTDYPKEAELVLNKISSIDDSARLSHGYYLLSSIYANINIDSAILFLDQSFTLNEARFCDIYSDLNKLYSDHELPDWTPVYFMTLEEFEQSNEKYRLTCDEYVIEENITQPNSFFTDIGLRDQKERSGSLKLGPHQDSLDRINREFLDDYLEHNDFSSLEDSESKIVWMVLQHSIDCEWNKKMFRVLLNAYRLGSYDGAFLEQTFTRFYDPETGYCTIQDPEDAKRFIDDLKQTYPKEYGDRFGYKSFN